MEVGYLTDRGHLVVVDTLGIRTLFEAYRIDEPRKAFEFLGLSSPMEPVADVRATVRLHRNGWRAEGEVLLHRAPLRLYRTRTAHLLIGATWKSLRTWRWGPHTAVHYPHGSGLRPLKRVRGVSPPLPNAPCVVLIEDESVKACRQKDTVVELFGVELKEFSNLVLGKLTAVVEFPTKDLAAMFARNFPRVEDPAGMDPSVRVDVNRSRKVVWVRQAVLSVAILVTSFGATAVLAVYTYLTGRADLALRGVSSLTGWSIFVLLYTRPFLALNSREFFDLRRKWPTTANERWISEAQSRMVAFLHMMRAFGLDLQPEAGGLAALDRFLRGLRRETYFRAFSMDAGAYVGAAIMGWLPRDAEFQWRYLPDYGDVVLATDPVDYWIAPIAMVAKIWSGKDPKPLEQWVREESNRIAMRLACRPLASLIALGFHGGDWDNFDPIAERLHSDLAKSEPKSYVLNENHFRVLTAAYSPFEFWLVEREVHGWQGLEFVPVLAIPSSSLMQTLVGRLDGVSPRSPARDDVAIIRFEGNELVPVGVQIRNYLQVGPSFAKMQGSLRLLVLAVADRAQVVTPRLRGLRPDENDFLSPMDMTEEGVPAMPYVRFLAQIVSVGELVNPFLNTPFWRIGLDVSRFRFEVLVRKDWCDGYPEPGHFLSGTCWLVADFPESGPEETTYIR